MLEKWTGEVVGLMHIYCIKQEDLAAAVGWTRPYLSRVLNGRRQSPKAQEKIMAALAQLILVAASEQLNRE